MATKIPVTTLKNAYEAVALTGVVSDDDFYYTLDTQAPDDKCFLVIDNREGSDEVCVSFLEGEYCGSAPVSTNAIPIGNVGVLFIDSIRTRTKNGVTFSVAPNAVGAKMWAVQALPVEAH